jgi:N-acetylmuramoyl-L-alanine amidase
MEEKVLKITTVTLLILTVLFCVILPYLPKIHTMQMEAQEERLAREELEAEQTKMKDLELLETSDEEGTLGSQLCLNLPEGVSGSEITVTNDYLTQTVRIEIPQIDADYFDKYPISGSSNHIDNMSYSKSGSEGVIEIAMDQVYELEESYDEEHYYFNFLTPHEVYDKVVVIDAGHGGRAPGASKQGIYEKNIDLAILLSLKEIFDESDENIGVYYTRTDDSNPTFDQRVQLANKSEADLFISIHNNSTGSGRMSSTNGTQVMYDEESESSKQLAQICLEEVTEALGSRNKGLVEGDSIYIIRTSEVPVALIEVGFMTNQEELKRLNSEEYQQQAAQGIYEAILRAFEEGY